MLRRTSPLLLLGLLVACTGSGSRAPAIVPAGQAEGARLGLLEAGAAALQRDAPPDALDVYLVGFHPMKADPRHQFEAHHFCRQVNADLMQCALFDGNTAAANLTGIEYVISEHLFAGLPEEEKAYWHPHNGEILSGQLIAPGLPMAAEHELMRGKINSYGKTWHTWSTGGHGDQATALPLGPPALAWSFNRDGEARPGLIEARDRAMGVRTAERQRARQDLVPLARPQAGVDALKDAFPGPTRPIPGVVDERAAAR